MIDYLKNNILSSYVYSFISLFSCPKLPTTEKELVSIGETKTLISDIAFKYLNDGKVVIYKGESKSWVGTYTLKYYEHWWTDKKGTLHNDAYNESFPSVKYKMSDIKSVGPIISNIKPLQVEGDQLVHYLIRMAIKALELVVEVASVLMKMRL